MDDAIFIKKSLIELCLNLLCICLASFWIVVTDVTFIAKLGAGLCILFSLIFVGHRNRQARNIIGKFSLTQAGLLPTKFIPTSAYEVSLHQLLPWCLHLKLSIEKSKFEKLIWRDSLCQDDWRKLRRYLLEKADETKSDRG